MNTLAEFTKYVMLFSFVLAFLLLLYKLLKELGFLSPIERLLNRSSLGDKILRADADAGTSTATFNTAFANKNTRIIISIILLVISTRIILYLLGYMGIMLLRNEANGFFNSFIPLWKKWDADHYLYIAQNWYVDFGDEKFKIVFFPLYSLIIKIVNSIIHNVFVSGIIVSNLSLIIGSFYLYKLTELDTDEDTALNSVKYLLFFPVSFFLSATFSESLFIALSVMTFYYIRKQNWFWAGVLGLLAALTRSLGVLLAIPYIIEFLIINKPFKENSIKSLLKSSRTILWVFLIPAGTFIYLYINKVVTGGWFTFIKYQSEHWHQNFGRFYENMKNFVLNAGTWKPEDTASLWIPQILLIVFAVALIFYSIRNLRISYSIYFFIYLLAAISPTWLLSGPRYIMSAFPIYLCLAIAAKNKKLDIVLTYAFLLLLGFCTLAYVTGHLIM